MQRGDVIGGVDEHLIHRINVDVLGGDVAQIDGVDARAVLHVSGHAGRGDDVIDREAGVLLQLLGEGGLAGEAAAGGGQLPLGIDDGDLLNDLEQSGAAGDADGLQRRGDGKADGFFGAGEVGDDEIDGEGVQPPIDTFDRGIKGFEVDGEVGSFLHFLSSSGGAGGV